MDPLIPPQFFALPDFFVKKRNFIIPQVACLASVTAITIIFQKRIFEKQVDKWFTVIVK